MIGPTTLLKTPTRALTLMALALLGAVGPSLAAVPVVGTAYSLDFPDGWEISTTSGSGNGIMVTRTGNIAVVLTATAQEANPLTEIEILNSSIKLGLTDSTLVTDKGTKTLGKYAFTFTEVKEHPSSTQLTRLYKAIQGHSVFTATLAYDGSQGTGPVTETEQALATLTFAGGAPVIPISHRIHPELSPAEHDALGRFRTEAALRLFRVPGT